MHRPASLSARVNRPGDPQLPTESGQVAFAGVDLEVHGPRAGVDRALGHAYLVVEPGVSFVLGLEQGHQQLTPDGLSIAVGEDRASGQVEEDLRSVIRGDDATGVGQHRAVTSAALLVGPVDLTREPLAGSCPGPDSPAEAGLVAIGTCQVEVAGVPEVHAAETIDM